MPMQRAAAQWTPAEKRLDTLSVSDRLSVRTNGTDWLIMVPNMGVELDLGKLNYNRLTAALNLSTPLLRSTAAYGCHTPPTPLTLRL